MTNDLLRAKQQLERHVLRLLADAYETNQDFCYCTLKALVAPEINREIIRAILIDLRKDGLATYAKGLWTDDGELAGSGYAITPEGRDYLRAYEIKKEPSVCEHPSCDKPAWTELDNEKLCKFHATEWLKGEQQAADDYQAEIDQLDGGYTALKGGV